jgi:hypothetical protein
MDAWKLESLHSFESGIGAVTDRWLRTALEVPKRSEFYPLDYSAHR